MSRLKALFEHKPLGILNIYCTAGYPEKDSTIRVMRALQNAGADIIELGIPYSDPLADGPVIQESSKIAIRNGMSISYLFEQLRDMRREIHIPVLLMGYLNTVLQYGFENFCKSASEAGVDGIILPDLPLWEFEQEYESIVKKYELDFIFLITPGTPVDRIRQMDKAGSGFLYAVSASATTGTDISGKMATDYFLKLKSMNLNLPVLIGFGIKDKQSFQTACSFASGAIIGTAYIKSITDKEDIESATANFVQSIKS